MRAPRMDNSSTSRRQLAVLALGIVFGDIGTSPLYAFRTALAVSPAMAQPDNVLGLLSILVWALVIVVCIKYVAIVLTADNRGEGGVLALSTLVLSGRVPWGRLGIGAMGLLGAALFFADGAITPAISVLSAVEGLTVGRPGLAPVVVPITLLILLFLFRLQSRGTARIGGLFGPVMLVWFAVLAMLGINAIAQRPEVLFALDPSHAVWFISHHGELSLAVISAVFLAVTGGEALFADLGHFGRRPIRLAWYAVVLPALLINYMGQGALVLANPVAAENPFFLLAPGWGLVVLVPLATVATVIASQAVISGVFSVVHQAVRLSYVPRLEVRHSSAQTFGQVYVPAANMILGIAAILLVLGFGSSAALAGAYGIAIATAMALDSILILVWLGQRPSRTNGALVALMSVILAVDLVFCFANFLKLPNGGWVPVVLGLALFAIMNTWTRGRVIVAGHIAREHRSVYQLQTLLASDHPPIRAPGSAVFLASNPEGLPRALWQNLRYNNVLHEQVLLVTIQTEEVPRVSRDRRFDITEVLPGITRIVAHYGFMENPQMTQVLYEAGKLGASFDPLETTYFVGTESVFYGRSTLQGWEKRLFSFLLRNSRRAASFYGVPDNRLVEFGTRLAV